MFIISVFCTENSALCFTLKQYYVSLQENWTSTGHCMHPLPGTKGNIRGHGLQPLPWRDFSPVCGGDRNSRHTYTKPAKHQAWDRSGSQCYGDTEQGVSLAKKGCPQWMSELGLELDFEKIFQL